MATLTIQLPPQRAQTEFNLRRWSELLADPDLAKVEGRVETDRYGHVMMTPPPAPSHGSYQFQTGALLDRHMPAGRVLTECPISTADGVRAADVAWASADRIREPADRACFPRSPEICVQVLSPGNTEAEMREKIALLPRRGGSRGLGLFGVGSDAFLPPGQGQTAVNLSNLSPFPGAH